MTDSRSRAVFLFLLLCLAFTIIVVGLRLAGVLPTPGRDPGEAYTSVGIYFEFADFDDLDGWRRGGQHRSLAPFLLSCAEIAKRPAEAPANPLEALGQEFSEGVSLAGRIDTWRRVCGRALEATRAMRAADAAEHAQIARSFFEDNFQPLRVFDLLQGARGRGPVRRQSAGKFTGYFEPIFDASRTRTEEFSAAALTRPDDLVMVDLGRFRDALAGERIAGRVTDGALTPYPARSEIAAGVLGARARPLAWLRPNDLFFLQIQGSGRLRFEGGRAMRIGYDGQNGHPYTAIGRLLVESGEMPLEAVTMQSIRAWLDAAEPAAADDLRNANASYVFFRELDGLNDPDLGPLGAQGVQLTPEYSLAVDRRYHAMGAPIWVQINPDGAGDGPSIRRLMVAQDTGGAIRGAVRGDIFAGAGVSAAVFAGGLNSAGEMFVLVPNDVASRLAVVAQ